MTALNCALLLAIVALKVLAALALPENSKDALREIIREPNTSELENLDKNLLQTQNQERDSNHTVSSASGAGLDGSGSSRSKFAENGSSNASQPPPNNHSNVTSYRNDTNVSDSDNNSKVKFSNIASSNTVTTTTSGRFDAALANTTLDKSSNSTNNEFKLDQKKEHHNANTVITAFLEVASTSARPASVSPALVSSSEQQSAIIAAVANAFEAQPQRQQQQLAASPPSASSISTAAGATSLGLVSVEQDKSLSDAMENIAPHTQLIVSELSLAAPTPVSTPVNVVVPGSAPSVIVAPTTAVPATVAPSLSAVLVPISTVAPTLIALSPQSVVSLSTTPMTALNASSDPLKEPCQKFELYMKPICKSLKNLTEKQIHRTRMQFTQFVAHTEGKLASCFKDFYSFQAPKLTETDLDKMCQSKETRPDIYQAFKKCLASKWVANIDKELERIIANRIKCYKARQLTPAEVGPTTAYTNSDEDEISLLEEVVAQVAEQELQAEAQKNSTVISVASGKLTTATPVTDEIVSGPVNILATTGAASGHLMVLEVPATIAAPAETTKLVIVAPTSTTSKPIVISLETKITTKAPTALVVIQSSSSAPQVVSSSDTSGKSVTVIANATGDAIVKDVVTILSSKTTAAPATATSSKRPKPATTSQPDVVLVAPTSFKPPTVVPEEASTPTPPAPTTTSTPTTPAATTTKAASTTTKSPVDETSGLQAAKVRKGPKLELKKASPSEEPTVFKIVTIDAEADASVKSSVSKKPDVQIVKESQVTAKSKPKVDEKAQKAIKDLLAQRENAKKGAIESHDHESKLHAIEHQRQMAIDPIGHTIKHQKYEAAKEQKMRLLRAQIAGN